MDDFIKGCETTPDGTRNRFLMFSYTRIDGIHTVIHTKGKSTFNNSAEAYDFIQQLSKELSWIDKR